MEYFIIYFGEDGIQITPATQEQVNERLKDAIGETTDEYPFVKELPENGYWDMNYDYPMYKTLIIKGRMVIPKVVATITEYKID